MRLLVPALCSLLAVALVPVPAAAQSEAAPVLQIEDSHLATPIVPDATPGRLSVPWTYAFPNAAMASAAMPYGSTTIEWTLSCPTRGVLLMGGLTTQVAFAAGQSSYSGQHELEVAATREAPGEETLACTAQAVGASPGPSVPATPPAEAQAALSVAFAGAVDVTIPSKVKQAGPQKMMHFDVALQNLGNARAAMRFGIVEGHSGGWKVILPSDVIVEAGETKTVPLMVATPFQNGPNKGSQDIEFTVTPVSTLDPDQAGEPVGSAVVAKVRGWYVPNPSMGIAALALLAVAFVARRR